MSEALYHDLAATDALLDAHFPLAAHGERLGIRIGPVSVGVCAALGPVDELRARYAPFHSDGPHDFTVEAGRLSDLDLGGFPDVRVRSSREGAAHYVFRWDAISRVEPEARRARILAGAMGSFWAVDTILRIAVSFAILEKGGFLVHSCAAAARGAGYLFCGLSGAGKSTVAKVSRGTKDVLTDEMSLVAKDGAGYRVWGTPFWGELQMSVNRSAPLAGAFVLAKARRNFVEPLPAAEALREFLRVVLCFGQSAGLCSRLMDSALDFLRATPVRRLHFVPDASFWEAIDDHVAGQGGPPS